MIRRPSNPTKLPTQTPARLRLRVVNVLPLPGKLKISVVFCSELTALCRNAPTRWVRVDFESSPLSAFQISAFAFDSGFRFQNPDLCPMSSAAESAPESQTQVSGLRSVHPSISNLTQLNPTPIRSSTPNLGSPPKPLHGTQGHAANDPASSPWFPSDPSDPPVPSDAPPLPPEPDLPEPIPGAWF